MAGLRHLLASMICTFMIWMEWARARCLAPISRSDAQIKYMTFSRVTASCRTLNSLSVARLIAEERRQGSGYCVHTWQGHDTGWKWPLGLCVRDERECVRGTHSTEWRLQTWSGLCTRGTCCGFHCESRNAARCRSSSPWGVISRGPVQEHRMEINKRFKHRHVVSETAHEL